MNSVRFAGLRDFLLIWIGQMVSVIGSRLTSFALGIWVLKTTGSTTKFALIFVAMALPALLVAPLAGALVDRWDRRRVMLACDALSATAMLTLAALQFSGQLQLGHIYAVAALSALANAFHQPAYAASVPLLADRDQLARVNGLVQTGFAMAQVLGPLLAGTLVATLSMSGVLLIDAATFLIGVATLAAAKVPRPLRGPERGDAEPSVWQEAAEGWRYVRERRPLLALLAVFGFTNFLFGIASIAITPLVLSFTDAAGLGAQMAVGGVGLVVGGIAMSTWGGPPRRIVGVLGFTALAGIALAAHGAAPSLPLVAAVGFLFFLCVPVIAASNDTLWQAKVPNDLQGRCFAIQRVLTEAAMPIGFCLAGPLIEHVFEPVMANGGALSGSVGALIGVGEGRGIALLFIVLGGLMTGVAALAWTAPTLRQIEERLPDAAPLTAATV